MAQNERSAVPGVQRILQNQSKMRRPLYLPGNNRPTPGFTPRYSLTKKVKVVSVGAGVPLPRRPKHSTPWGAVA